MENDPKEFMRAHVIATAELSATNDDGPITLPLLDCWYAPAFGDENAPRRQVDAQRIRLVLTWQQLSELGQEIQDFLQGKQIPPTKSAPFSVQ